MNFHTPKRLTGGIALLVTLVSLALSTSTAVLAQDATVVGEQYGSEAGSGGTADGPESDSALPPEVAPPAVSARSWIIVDAESGEALAGENAASGVPMASTTKIMTALVTLQNADLDEEVRVSDLAASFAIPAYSNAGLQQGDVLTVREMLRAALIVSGNDAAIALAEHVGGGGGQRGVNDFVGMMNAEAERLGLSETRFENPTGLDEDGHYSSARDLARLARAATASPVFRWTVSTEYTTVSTQSRDIELTNVNDLLYLYPAATGVKTGTSPGAGPSLVGSAVADGEGYIAVILDADDRYGSMVSILDYGFAAYDVRALVRRGEDFEEVQTPYRRDERVSLIAGRDVEALVGSESRVETRTVVPDDLPESAGEGERIGEVILTVDGERVGESPLVAEEGYEEVSIFQKFGYSVSRLWN